MSYSEFPDTNYYDTDLSVLIEMYKKLLDDYDGLLSQITDVNNRLTKYQSTVPAYVANIVSLEIENYRRDCDYKYTLLRQQIVSVKEDIDAEVSHRKLEDEMLEVKIEEMNRKFDTLNSQYEKKFSEMRLMILGSNAHNRKLIEECVAYCKGLVEGIPKSELPVFNPIRVMNDTINNAIKDIYNHGITTNGFTAIEWHKETHITCRFFKDSAVTCLEYWTDGKPLLGAYNNRHMVFSPTTGEYVPIEKALEQLANYVKEFGITAKRYDDKLLTAEAYDNKNVTASEYDFNAKGELSDV